MFVLFNSSGSQIKTSNIDSYLISWYGLPLRSTRPEVFCKESVLKNFTKFTGKHLCQILFFSKVQLLKRETLAQVFSCEFCEIFKNTFFIEHLQWLLLTIQISITLKLHYNLHWNVWNIFFKSYLKLVISHFCTIFLWTLNSVWNANYIQPKNNKGVCIWP